MTDKIVVFSSCGSKEEGARLARQLVEQRLAACVSILEGVTSVYRWQGAIEEAAEVLLVIKTRRELFEQLREELRAMHSYQTPEVLAMPVVDGLPAYLDWLDRETGLPSSETA
ncbi:MAG: divalent-cation tolerance protein CutA [Bryobacteraceae bacterium]